MCSAKNRSRPGTCGRRLSQGTCPAHGATGAAGTATAATLTPARTAAAATTDPFAAGPTTPSVAATRCLMCGTTVGDHYEDRRSCACGRTTDDEDYDPPDPWD